MRIRGNLGNLSGRAVAAVALVAIGHSAAMGDVDIIVEVHHSSFMVASAIPGQGTAHGTVEVGDVVRWVWMSSFHSVTADAGQFDSDIQSTPFEFEHTFAAPGTFPYHCIIHGAPGGIGMSGSITVVPAPGAMAAVAAAGLLAARRRRR